MKYLSYILLAVFVGFVLTACDDEKQVDFEEALVVDGAMYVGQRLEVRLTHTIPFDQAYYPDEVRVTGADVWVTVNGTTAYALTEEVSGVPGTYALPDTVAVVTTGNRYDLLVVWEGDSSWAYTYATGPIELTEAVLINVNNEITDTAPDTLEYGGDQLRLTWTTDPANFGYALQIEAMDESKYGEDCDVGDDNGPGTYLFTWTTRFINSQDLPWISLCYDGPTMIRVFTCDTAYWNFASTTLIGDPNNDPVSNVENGFGVFCAIDCDTFQFMLTDTLED
ncbi:MAG: DUF4249 family protein [bacterium]|nr:DUF4249 family protein [bacterium]